MRFKDFISGFFTSGKSEYASLLTRLKSGDTSIDFARLRTSYVESPEHEAGKHHNPDQTRKAAFAALAAKDFRAAAQLAGEILDVRFVDLDAHLVKYLAHSELGEQQLSKFHKLVYTKLLKSITASGDGQSIATAYHVISITEEYAVLRAFRMALIRQSLLRHEGHAYDYMEVRNLNNGAASALYFNVDIPLRTSL